MITFTVALYVVSRLVLSPIFTRPAAQQQHRVSWEGVGWWGGPGHYVVTSTQVEVELRLSWAVTIRYLMVRFYCLILVGILEFLCENIFISKSPKDCNIKYLV